MYLEYKTKHSTQSQKKDRNIVKENYKTKHEK